jgi:hypothetical protein
MDAGMKLRKNALKLFNEEEIEYKITGLFNSLRAAPASLEATC